MNLYEWLPTESAPIAFPMEIIEGTLFYPGSGSIYIPDRRPFANGWGRTGSMHLVGDDAKPVPERLELTWFSYAEDKFYSGRFELNHARLDSLFDAGLPPLPGADFAPSRSPVSLQADHPFRAKPITHFAPSRSPVSVEADQGVTRDPGRSPPALLLRDFHPERGVASRANSHATGVRGVPPRV